MKLTSFSDKFSTIGKLHVDSKFICYTLERPWLDNEPNVSCVPAGNYRMKPHTSPSKGKTYYLRSLDDDSVKLFGPAKRTHILLHPGNTIEDSAGCILVGDSYGIIDGQIAVMNSKKTFERILNLFKWRDFNLEIERYYEEK